MATKKDKSSTTLVLKDQGVQSIVKFLNDELDTLKKETEQPPHTTGQMNLGNGNILNIQTETDVEVLVKGLSSLVGRKKFYDEAASLLGTEVPVFNCGGTIEHWVADIKIRIAFLKHESRKKELEDLKREAAQFMTVEDQKEMFMEKMKKVLGKQ